MDAMRSRITVRGEGVELRGYIDGEIDRLGDFAKAMEGIGLVLASPAEDDFDPFREERQRELHHFETEQENERLRNEQRCDWDCDVCREGSDD
jgi:hypothetical protein